MHNTLFVTGAEKQLFDALSPELKEGWKLEPETLTYTDTPERRQVRLDLMELDDGQFENIMLRCGPQCSEKDLETLIAEVDFTNLSERDLWEICFALGADAMTYLIAKLLIDAKTDEQIEGVCAFTHLRHRFLESVQ